MSQNCKIEGCKEDRHFDGYCLDHWPGYDLCKACNDYRCEHIEPTEEALRDAEFTSCHCGSSGCRTGFVEGSTRKIISMAQWRELRKAWGCSVESESRPQSADKERKP